MCVYILMDNRGGAIQFFGTKRHHDKWLKDTENYLVKGCFAMTELGHGSNVCGECIILLMIFCSPNCFPFPIFLFCLAQGPRN